MIGYSYQCERCSKRVWLASGVGAGIYLFVALWFSVFFLLAEKDPNGLLITAALFVALGGREAFMRHRYPRAA